MFAKNTNQFNFNAFGFKCTFHASIGRDKSDPEKAVLPTVIFINTNHEDFEPDIRKNGFVLALGWWDFSVKVALILT